MCGVGRWMLEAEEVRGVMRVVCMWGVFEVKVSLESGG